MKGIKWKNSEKNVSAWKINDRRLCILTAHEKLDENQIYSIDTTFSYEHKSQDNYIVTASQ